MRNLSAFMKLRDTEPVFDSVKGTGTIGLPCLLTEDETVTIDWKGWLTANGYTAEEQAENACSIDGKRC